MSERPTQRDPQRPRRIAAIGLAVAGLLDVVSALTPPFEDRFQALVALVPLAVPEVASTLVVIAGLGLVSLSRGVRRGQRVAWSVALSLLGASVVLHIIKGVDVEEAAAAAALLVLLVRWRWAFSAPSDPRSRRRALLFVLIGSALTISIGTAIAELTGGANRLPLRQAVMAVAHDLVGVGITPLPGRVGLLLTPGLLVVGAALALTASWLACRPVAARWTRRGEAAHSVSPTRARSIVASYGNGTLDYFALRDDKEHFVWRSTLVAFAVRNGICLVSPDPIGPVDERARALANFRSFASARGWPVAVLGASEEWLPTYRAVGMRSVYMGDEAIVDCPTFSLQGGTRKALRQAVNRIAKHGYTIGFYRSGDVDPELRTALQRVMTRSRRGDAERGFSMTLGRTFDEADADLLLAVARDPVGRAVAFCQFVPARGINGWSLDIMRRDDGEHPNGLTDFVVVRTIEHLRAHGHEGLALNFAALRSFLDTAPDRPTIRTAVGWLVKRYSTGLQVESLWRYNAKFGPWWQPRYAVYDAPEHLVPIIVAMAKAESIWEIPLVGRFLRPQAAA